ncbi:hypothetical protein D3C80_1787090 [compost metagenome]
MLHDRQQFDMGEAHLLDVWHQSSGEFAPVVEARHFAGVVQLALPGACVQLVDRQRCMGRLTFTTDLHPGLVLPVVCQGAGHP